MMQAYRTEGNYRSAARLSPAELRAAMANREILQATALAFDTQRQLRFEIGGVRAVMPFAQCADGAANGTVRDIAVLTRVGRPTCFVIEALDTDENGQPFYRLSRALAQQIPHHLRRPVEGRHPVTEPQLRHRQRRGRNPLRLQPAAPGVTLHLALQQIEPLGLRQYRLRSHAAPQPERAVRRGSDSGHRRRHAIRCLAPAHQARRHQRDHHDDGRPPTGHQ